MTPSLALRLLLVTTLAACSFDLSRDLADGDVQGRAVLLDADGKPVAAADTVVRVEGSPVTVKADARGRFKVRGLPRGTYTLRFEHSSGASLRLRKVEQAGGVDLGDLALGRLGALEGTLTRAGEPVAGVVVLAGLREVALDEGVLRIADLPPGEFSVVLRETSPDKASGDLFDLGLVTVAPGATTSLTLDLETRTPLESFGFTGTARLAGETDHSRIRVEAVGAMEVPAETSADGLYVDPGLQPGVYTVRAYREGFRDQVLPLVVVGGDFEIPDILLLPASAGCEAGGLAVTEDDKDADGVADADEPEACRCAEGTTDTDEDGLCDPVDEDRDNDGYGNVEDNCVLASNADQADADGDGAGDACDPLCGEAAVDCATLDTACTVGFCEPETRACSTRPRENGTTCDDGDPCTVEDACAAGVCAGPPRDCSGSPDGCQEGACDSLTGECTTTDLPDDTECDDESLCTFGDLCVSGLCVGQAIDCGEWTNSCNAGECNPQNGQCFSAPLPDTTECDDFSFCTTNDHCDGAGNCNGARVDCSAEDGLCREGVCIEGEGAPLCFAAPLSAVACTDDNPCTWGSSCGSGTCGVEGLCEVAGIARRSPSGTQNVSATTDPVFEDLCGDGQVVIGFGGSLDIAQTPPALVGVTARCAAVSVSEEAGFISTSIIPLGTTFPPRGSGQGTAESFASCPTGEVVVGLSTKLDGSGGSVSALRIDCAPLTLQPDRPRPPAVVLGAVTSGAASAGTFTGPASFSQSCPPGTVAIGQRGAAGFAVSAFGLTCATVEPKMRVTSPFLGGNAGGGVSVDDCPEGEAIIGVDASTSIGFYNQGLLRFSFRCGWLSPGAAQGSGFALDVSPGSRVPSVGDRGNYSSFDPTPMSITCPANTVAVGATVESSPFQGFASRLSLDCAPVTATGSFTLGFDPVAGPVSTTTPVGRLSGPAGSGRCPPGTLATGFWVHAGEIVDGLKLRCSPLVLNPG